MSSDSDAEAKTSGLSTGEAVSAAQAFAPGELLAGRYRIVRFLAKGGMGEVYEALDLELDESVALKTLRPELAGDERLLERFKRELSLARKVTHPHVARVFDLGRHTGPPAAAFLTMELLPGETLGQHLRSRGRLSPAEALPLARAMASALQAAHRASVVHQDFKAENVMLVRSADGTRVVVTDFGLARAARPKGEHSPATRTHDGLVLGTPAYMAPEQVEGGAVTPSADIYALGVVLYELVTGRRPFEGDTPLATAVKHLKEPPPPPRVHVPDLDPLWEQVILRCLAKSPGERFQSAEAVVQALERRPQSPSRRPLALAALLLGLGLLAVLLLRQPAPGSPPSPSPRASVAARRSLAVLGFRNSSGRPEAAWLGTALGEMLATEIGGGQIRLIPGETVSRARLELQLAKLDTLAPHTLAQLRSGLGSDLVLFGSYVALGQQGGGALRLDLRIQDTASGETLGTLKETGTEPELLALVARAGTQLRAALGEAPLAVTLSAGLSLPRDARAARLYAEGLERLRHFDAVSARARLQEAALLEPGFPLTHMALSRAWAALGHDAHAQSAAQRAFELSEGLPREERLLVEARYREAAGQWARAVEIRRTLWEFFPDDLEHGLALGAARVAAGQGAQALLDVDSLRALPSPQREDARIDLAEAQAASAISEFGRQRDASARAAAKGQRLGLRLLRAAALLSQADALFTLGEPRPAEGLALEARGIFVEVGDRAGAARALRQAGTILYNRGERDEARRLYEQALAEFRAVGDLAGTAQALNSLAVVAKYQGDPQRARRLYEQAVAIDRETGNGAGLASRLSNLSMLLVLQGDLEGARRTAVEAIALRRARGDRSGLMRSLENLADLDKVQGDLAGARAKYLEALQVSREVGEPKATAHALSFLGELATTQGDLKAARGYHQEALEIRNGLDQKLLALESLLDLATVALESGQAEPAASEALRIAEAFGAGSEAGREQWARGVLAQARIAQGRFSEARAALARAEQLGASEPETRLWLAGLSARVRAGEGDLKGALRQLEATLQQALRAGVVEQQYETRLALGELERAVGREAAGQERLLALVREAEGRGYGLVVAKARQAAAAPLSR